MQQSEPAITQMIKLTETFITKLIRHIVLDASQDLKTLWGLCESLTVLNSILHYKCYASEKEVLL